jgi:hypothetical protein
LHDPDLPVLHKPLLISLLPSEGSYRLSQSRIAALNQIVSSKTYPPLARHLAQLLERFARTSEANFLPQFLKDCVYEDQKQNEFQRSPQPNISLSEKAGASESYRWLWKNINLDDAPSLFIAAETYLTGAARRRIGTRSPFEGGCEKLFFFGAWSSRLVEQKKGFSFLAAASSLSSRATPDQNQLVTLADIGLKQPIFAQDPRLLRAIIPLTCRIAEEHSISPDITLLQTLQPGNKASRIPESVPPTIRFTARVDRCDAVLQFIAESREQDIMVALTGQQSEFFKDSCCDLFIPAIRRGLRSVVTTLLDRKAPVSVRHWGELL